MEISISNFNHQFIYIIHCGFYFWLILLNILGNNKENLRASQHYKV